MSDNRAQALAALGAGFAVLSTSTPAINGLYPVDPTAQLKLLATAFYVATNGRFPAGQTSWIVPDMRGGVHAFPTTSLFLAFATAVADYVAVLMLIADGVTPGAPLPFNAVNLP